ncbi:hypothetical protein [Azohydromonas aeria]|uniref:hypothetical protein n=1 Tax=Azohydromonas aeria TaxID=2590212 RepID=UPI0012FCFD53|nr:hypothetical protein [Azohydromonas aeria]
MRRADPTTPPPWDLQQAYAYQARKRAMGSDFHGAEAWGPWVWVEAYLQGVADVIEAQYDAEAARRGLTKEQLLAEHQALAAGGAQEGGGKGSQEMQAGQGRGEGSASRGELGGEPLGVSSVSGVRA